jgi:hypothetical protein
MQLDDVPPYESLAGREMINTLNNPSTGNESFAGRQMINTLNNPSTGNPLSIIIPIFQ